MAHHHHHHLTAGHSHAPVDFGRAFLLGIALNGGFVLAEAGYGLAAHSLAMVADAGHNLGDVFGLLMAWGAARWAGRPPTLRHTYGWGRLSILAALCNATFLLVSVGVIAWEAVRRLWYPVAIEPGMMIWVSAAGIIINGATALLFAAGRKGDLNVRSTFQHMAADAVLSAGVLVTGIAILRTHWLWLDPVISLILVTVIVVGTWGLLRESVDLASDAIPAGVNADDIRSFLRTQPGVIDVHHLHIWSLSTTRVALTAHLVVAAARESNELLHRIQDELEERFGIEHATLQFEFGASCSCHSRECTPGADRRLARKKQPTTKAPAII